MGGKLDSTINYIDTNDLFLLTIFDIDKAEFLMKYMPAPKIREQYGTGTEFFENLNANGHKNLIIKSHKKSGTGKPKLEEPFTVRFSDGEQTELQPIAQPVATPQPVMQNLPMLKNELSLFGLGVPQLMDLHVEKNEANRLRTENAELKSEYKRLTEENKKLHEQILSDKYDYEKQKDKSNTTKEIISGLAGVMPVVMEHLRPPQNGLGAAQTENFGSLIKNNFAQNLKSLDDATVIVLDKILNELSTNEQFSNQFTELLKKHQIWQ